VNCSFCTLAQLPNIDRMYDFIYKTVALAVETMVENQSTAIGLALRRLILSYDAAHDGVVKARHTRGALVVQNKGPHQGKVLRAMSTPEGDAGARELPILRKLMAWAKDRGLDLVEICIDESPAQKTIREAVRAFAPELLSTEPSGEVSLVAFEGLPAATQEKIAEKFTKLTIDMCAPQRQPLPRLCITGHALTGIARP
jgi:hypothetical protein